MNTLRIISGGQSGADRAGLEAAHALGIETGGWVPLKCKTEFGPAPELVTKFGCIEHLSADYADRTWANVQMADLTLWFGSVGSRGYSCTSRACTYFGKSLVENPTHNEIRDLLLQPSISVVNIAGNRASHNPQLSSIVRELLTAALTEVLKTKAAGCVSKGSVI